MMRFVRTHFWFVLAQIIWIASLAVVNLNASNAASGGGDLKDEIGKTIQKHSKEIKACYEARLSEKPELAGKVVVGFTLDAAAQAKGAKLEGSSVKDEALERCLVTLIEGIKDFPPAGGAPVSVSYPFVFKPTK